MDIQAIGIKEIQFLSFFSSEILVHEYPTEFFVMSGWGSMTTQFCTVMDICIVLLLNYNLGI